MKTPYDHLVFIEKFEGMPMAPQPNVFVVDITDFFSRQVQRRSIGSSWCREYKPHNGPAKGTPQYRTMCHFWFAEFMQYAHRYRYIMRLDSDCMLSPNQKDPFLSPPEYIESASYQGMDYHNLIHNMADLFRTFDTRKNKHSYWHSWKSPYTSIMYINMTWARSDAVQKIVDAVNQTNCIIGLVQGDLPLWGAIRASLRHTSRRYT